MFNKIIYIALVLSISTQTFALKFKPSIKHEKIQLNVKGQDRIALIVNSAKSQKVKRPVIIELHGGAGSAEGAIELTKFDELAHKEGFIAVYAQGSEFRRGMHAWNTGYLLRNQVKKADDIAYLDGLIDKLILKHGADPDRIYMSGVSNGAMMTFIYATKRAHRLAAAAPMVGAMFNFEEKPSSSLPIIIVCGAKDTTVPITGGYSKKRFVKKNQFAPYKSQSETAKFWAKNNKSSQKAKITKLGSLDISTYSKTKNGNVTISIVDREGGHGWPGSEARLPNDAPPIQAFDAANIAWKFFKNHSREKEVSNSKSKKKPQSEVTKKVEENRNDIKNTNKFDSTESNEILINDQTIRKLQTQSSSIYARTNNDKQVELNSISNQPRTNVSQDRNQSCKLGQLKDIPTKNGSYSQLWICSKKGKRGTLKRNYNLVIPKLENRRESGLLLVLHGGGGKPDAIAKRSNFHSYGQKYGFVTVYPEGYKKKWNSGHAGTQAAEAEIDDVHFLSTLIDELLQKLKLDEQKVFVTGHSNGGMMTHRLGAEASQKIAGIAPVAGTVGGFANIHDRNSYYHIPKASSNIKVFAIHGKCDTSVTYDGSRGPTTNRRREDISTMEGIKFWANVNSCGRSTTHNFRRDKHLPMTTYSYGCAKKNKQTASVKLLTINDTGHVWPDGSGERKTKIKPQNKKKIKKAIQWGQPRACSLEMMINASKRIDAAEVIVQEFFKK